MLIQVSHVLWLACILDNVISYHRLLDSPDWILKVERAKHHLEELTNVLSAYRSGDSFKVNEERKPGEWIWTLSVNTPPPSELSLIAGDVIHNLRSALNCRVVAIAEKLTGGKLMEDEEKQLDFVIFDRQDDFENYAKRWVRLPPEVSEGVTKCIGVFQRYAPPSKYWTDPKTFGDDECFAQEQHLEIFDRLRRLFWLSNRDKHRRLHTVLLAPSEGSHSGFPITAHYEFTERVIESGDIIARLLFDQTVVPKNASAEICLVPVLENSVQEGDVSLHGELEGITYFVEIALKILDFEETHLGDT